MKKFNLFKTIQLIIFIVLAGAGLYIVLTDKELYHMIATNPHIRMLCTLLWVVCGISFLFIFLDFSLFSTLKKDYQELDYVVSSDPIAGIANRFSCDAVIEKYLDRPMPPHICSVMFELSNLMEVNQERGHMKGNELIREFSSILQNSAVKIAFVGRNGGNKFLAIIEDCNEEKLNTFLTRINDRVNKHNQSNPTLPIRYNYGVALDEDSEIATITELIALSNRRISR